jgi:hypothetical protein
MSRARPYVRQSATPQQRLDHYTDKSAGPEGCWLWMGALTHDGYGHLHLQGRYPRAHRLAFAMANGVIPPDTHVLHRCDNRRCVNPGHLFAGSHLDNMRDMAAKGRRPRGEGNGQAKLTADKVKAIRAASGSQREIAAAFGVCEATVNRIKHGRTWRHLAMADAVGTCEPRSPAAPCLATGSTPPPAEPELRVTPATRPTSLRSAWRGCDVQRLLPTL